MLMQLPQTTFVRLEVASPMCNTQIGMQLSKEKKTLIAAHSALVLTISASKGVQMYHIQYALPFRLRENSFAVTRRRSSQTARNIGGRRGDTTTQSILAI